MNQLPNYALAALDARKLEDYCLNPAHPRGRHKARVFRNELAIDRNDSAWLRSTLLEALATSEAVPMISDGFGSRWRVDVTVVRQKKQVVIRSVWMIRTGEETPRFVTCWVL